MSLHHFIWFAFEVLLYAILLSVIPANCRDASEKEFIFEAENAIIDRGRLARIMPRSLASGRRSVALSGGASFHLDFCLYHTSSVKVQGIRYSNDGPADHIQITIDQEMAGLLHTEAIHNMGGKGWNTFLFINGEGEPITVLEGRHRLTVTVLSSDVHGVEIDYIQLFINGSQNEFTLNCQVYCFNSIEYKAPMRTGPPATPVVELRQKSAYTKCAEEDNVNIPVYGRQIKKYSITATFPKYRSFNNSRDPDFENCYMVSALWTFTDIEFVSEEENHRHLNKASIGPKFTKHHHGNVAAMIVGMNSDKRIAIEVEFMLDGTNKGVIDSEIGSILYLRLRKIEEALFVRLTYRGRGKKWVQADPEVISRGKLYCRWQIPDFTWSEGSGNIIKVEMESVNMVYAEYNNMVEIEVLELSRRYKRATESFHMYNDGKYLIEGADIDFWWLLNKTMTVTVVDTGKTYHSADYVRVYQNIPWAKDHFSQIIVLYQDGNVRLLPIVPHGLDWIPFGSSILLGQSDPSEVRPSSPIRHVDMTIKTLTMDIYFYDGGELTVKILPTNTNTSLLVEHRRMNKGDDRQFPFLTIRSMWVADGNADIDHVVADMNEAEHVMSRWGVMKGRYFAFFRRCISRHNTQSPDLVLQTIE